MPLTDDEVRKFWQSWFTTGEYPGSKRNRRIFGMIPSSPRCKLCNAPFEGIGAPIARVVFSRRRSAMNPQFCSACEDMVRKSQAGAEVEMSMLFADVRGSTALSERMSPMDFSQLINRFYTVVTRAIVEKDGLVDKLAGDSVAAFWGEGIAGPNYVQRTIETAVDLLKATGHADPHGPWIPIGVGVHAGIAYFGALGTAGGLTDVTAIGEEVNTTARLSSSAAAGEILVSEQALAATGLDPARYESRSLELKGLSEPVAVRVMRVSE